MTPTTSRTQALAAFAVQRADFLGALAAVPDAALAYRPAGEDYALGGLVEHVAGVVRHYAAVLAQSAAADFQAARVPDSGAQQDAALVAAGLPPAPAERRQALQRLAAAHASLVAEVERLAPEDFARATPVWYGAAPEPYPTSAADVLGWVGDHYAEHTTQIAELVDRWAAEGSAPADIDAARTRATVDAFNAAFNRHDVDAVMALMTDDCAFEDTEPAPDGARYTGQAAVRERWRQLFAASPKATFTAEEVFVHDDRAVVRWRYDWGTGHVRGVDLIHVRDGKVAEKLSYVKG